MKKILNFVFNPNSSINDLALLIMRVIPSYYMFFDHGKGKILNSSRWEGLGSSLTKYLNDSFEPINIFLVLQHPLPNPYVLFSFSLVF